MVKLFHACLFGIDFKRQVNPTVHFFQRVSLYVCLSLSSEVSVGLYACMSVPPTVLVSVVPLVPVVEETVAFGQTAVCSGLSSQRAFWCRRFYDRPGSAAPPLGPFVLCLQAEVHVLQFSPRFPHLNG